jgi:hypothetical protein
VREKLDRELDVARKHLICFARQSIRRFAKGSITDMGPFPEMAELEAYRLDRDWSWIKLSEAMAKRGVKMSPRTLYHLLKRAHPDERPHDRTLHKIRLYLKRTEAERRRFAERAAATQ